jgi:hypothetical protein
MNINPDDLRINCAPDAISVTKTIGRQNKCFIKGPLPHAWISRAIAAGNSAISLGLVLWFLRGWKKQNEFRLTNVELRKWNIDRHQKYRGLVQLEKAGLIKVKRENCKNPKVKLLKAGPL